MLSVSLSGSLRSAADDVESIQIEAKTIRELMWKIVERYPRMSQHIDEVIAVSIDGELFRVNWDKVIPVESEVYLLPRIPGG